MTPEARQERQRKTVDMVDTYLECAGLQTYTQRGLMIAELMTADAVEHQTAIARYHDALDTLRKIEALLRTNAAPARCVTAARLLAVDFIAKHTANNKEKAA